jgi:hypothetical protein
MQEDIQIMKERKYKNDWVNERRLDPKTGRETTVPVYKGSYFKQEKPEDTKKRAIVFGLLGLLFLGLLFAYYLLDFPGTRVMYVFLPSSLCLFPALYWLMGYFSSFVAPEKMTRTDREVSVGRVLRSAAGGAVFSAIAVIGDLVFLLGFQAPSEEWWGFLLLVGTCATALFSAWYARGIYQGIKEVTGK